MNKEKWNDIWKIMKSGRLEFDNCNNDILCIICKNVLINAHSGPCGCRYCLECITKYLNGEENVCPGNTDYCTDELLNLNGNIHTDQSINRKILETIVKCSQENCEFKDKLMKIEDHLRICDFRTLGCPYLDIGCKNYNSMNTDMKNHMLVEIISHTKLLFEYIDNLKNEIKVIKDEKVALDKNNKDLMKCINDLQLKFENDIKETKEMLKAMENKFEEQKNSVEPRKEMKMLNEDIEFLKNNAFEHKKCIDDLKLKCESDNKEIKDKLEKIEKKEEIEEQKDNIIQMKKEMKVLNEEIISLKTDVSENKSGTSTKINEINKIITDLKSISNESDKSISNVMNEMRVLQMIQEQGNCGGFVWRINNWKEKTEQAQAKIQTFVDSDTFYSHRNGYELCLSVGFSGDCRRRGSYLSVWCYVMQGVCDDKLPWPFKYDITFELINQHTSEVHITSTLRYDDWYVRNGCIGYERDNQKPENDSYCVCYNDRFISLQELSNNLSLIDNDRILIRCRVTIID